MGIVLQFLHLKSLTTPSLCVSQMRHLLHPESGLDVELCLASHFLGLSEIQRRVEKSVLSGITLSTYIQTCKYAAQYNMASILRGCTTWLKRFPSVGRLTRREGVVVCRKKKEMQEARDAIIFNPRSQKLIYGDDSISLQLLLRICFPPPSL